MPTAIHYITMALATITGEPTVSDIVIRYDQGSHEATIRINFVDTLKSRIYIFNDRFPEADNEKEYQRMFDDIMHPQIK